MKSIRRDLATRMGGAALVVLLVGGFGLYISLRQALQKQFDDVLVAKTGALVMASEIDEGELEIDLDVQTFAGFGTGAPGDYFEVYAEDGKPVMRSPSLGSSELALPAGFGRQSQGFADVTLPESASGRAFWTSYAPSLDDGEDEGAVPPELKILVASADAAHRRTLRTVALFIAVFGGLGIVLMLAIMKAVVRTGLVSLDRLSGQVEDIDSRRLAKRVPVEGLPMELRGMGAKINELLARLEESFGREKQFTSNAAHELRTPLAELRTMTELGTRWPEEFTEEHGREMLEVIAELEGLLETLSLLARAESGAAPATDSVDLGKLVAEQLDRVRRRVEERHLEVQPEIAEGEFRSDPALCRAIIQNLLDNAVDYSPGKSRIRVEAGPDRFLVENEAPDLEGEDLDRLFARFWRKSESRSGKEHSGLGLSVVRAAAEHLGGGCSAELVEGRLLVRVDWPVRGEGMKERGFSNPRS